MSKQPKEPLPEDQPADRSRARLGAVALAAAAALGSSATASVVPQGPERPVHPAFAAGDQNSSSVAMSPSGVSVVVWEEVVLEPALDHDIFGQLFDACGDPIGNRIDIPPSQETNDTNPVVAMSSTGEFVVVWRDGDEGVLSRDGAEGHGAILRRFDATGEPIEAYQVVNENAIEDQYPGRVAYQPDGAIVVAWEDQNPIDGGAGRDLWARIYPASGAEPGLPFRVNTVVEDTQSDCALAVDADGRFAIVWSSSSPVGCSGSHIRARLFAADGSPISGVEEIVNISCEGDQQFPSVAFDDAGGFLVVWDSLWDDEHQDVRVRRVDVGGVPVDPEIVVSSETGVGVVPVITRTVGGGFLVAWVDVDPGDGSGAGILARCLDGAGAPSGDPFRVNGDLDGDQSDIGVSSSGDGRYDLAWTTPDGAGSTDIHARRFAEPTCATGTVNALSGPIVDVLFLNGSAGDSLRTVHVAAGDLVWAAILSPPAGGNGLFAIHAEASGALSPVALPFCIGTTCFELLLTRGGAPEAIWNNAGRRQLLGDSRDFDGPIAAPSRAPTVFYTAWGGISSLPSGTRVTFQGVLSDRGSAAAPIFFSATNAVTLEIH